MLRCVVAILLFVATGGAQDISRRDKAVQSVVASKQRQLGYKILQVCKDIPNFSHNAAVVESDILIVVRIGQYGSSQGFFR